MTQDERKSIDHTCLCILGHKPEEWHNGSWWEKWEDTGDLKERLSSPSLDEELVVPLAEALRKRGWEWGHISWDNRGFHVMLHRAGQSMESEWSAASEWHESMQEALAEAAARAVERSGEE